MDTQNFDIENWRALSLDEKQQTASALLKTLPKGWTFAGIRGCELGGQSNEIAIFQWQEEYFSLVPGNTAAVLGFDPAGIDVLKNLHLRFCEEEREIYNADENDDFEPMEGCPDPLELVDTLVKNCLTPVRTVSIAPFLCEISPKSQTEPFGMPDARFWTTYEELEANLTPGGFRLLASDEWEYACAAGTRTVFRWGNEISYAVFGPNYLGESENPPWDLPLQPNAFGVCMPYDSYIYEAIAEKWIFRGGDGGTAVHGGEVGLPQWITLASAFVEKFAHRGSQEILPSIYARRVFTILQ